MSALFLPTLLASLAGGLHCAGMCGPFSAACGFEPHGPARFVRQLPYHCGRLLTYGALGGAAGALGHALDLGGKLAGFSRVSALVAGLTMIAFGLAPFVRRAQASSLVTLGRSAPSAGLFTRLFASFSKRAPMTRAFLLGLTTTLLPCGWLYAFVALAAGTGSFASGLTTMVAFWLGTVPWLLGASLGLRALVPRFGARARPVSALLIAASGVFLIAFRLEGGLEQERGAPESSAVQSSGAARPACPFHAP